MSLSKIILSALLVSIAISSIEARWGNWGGFGGWSSESYGSYGSYGSSSEEVTAPATCNNEYGLYFNGTTLQVYYTGSISQCCSNCQADAACYSYSYNPYNGRCYKVSASTVRVYDGRFQSGLVRTGTPTTTVAPVTVTLTIPVTTTAAPATTTQTVGCFTATNYNYIGGDFNSTIVSNYTDCCNVCGNTAGCVAWTWNFLTNVCYLKNVLPSAANQVPLTYSYSGVVSLFPSNATVTTTTATTTTAAPTTTTVAATTTTTGPLTTRSVGCFVENDFNYVGSDVSASVVNSIGDCCNLCGANSACAVFTYTISTRVCSLKSVVALTQRVPAVGSISGVVTLR